MLGMTEIIAIGVIALVVIGPEKFPDFAKMVFKTIRELRGHVDDLKHEVNKEINPLKGKFDELRRIDPEKYIDQLVKGDDEDEEDGDDEADKDPSLASTTPGGEMDYESDAYWENDEYGTEPTGGVEDAVDNGAEARDESELTQDSGVAVSDSGADDTEPEPTPEELGVPYVDVPSGDGEPQADGGEDEAPEAEGEEAEGEKV